MARRGLLLITLLLCGCPARRYEPRPPLIKGPTPVPEHQQIPT